MAALAGAQRNDIVAESSGWNGTTWASGKPLWSAAIGLGSSSPLIVGDSFYVFGWRNGTDVVSCPDAATGNQRWQQSYAAPKYGRHHELDERFYAGPSSTPEYDAETGSLFTLSLDGEPVAWDTPFKEGQVALAETSKRSPDKYTELARLGPLFETDVWLHAVLAAGRLLCKDREGRLKCFALPK